MQEVGYECLLHIRQSLTKGREVVTSMLSKLMPHNVHLLLDSVRGSYRHDPNQCMLSSSRAPVFERRGGPVYQERDGGVEGPAQHGLHLGPVAAAGAAVQGRPQAAPAAQCRAGACPHELIHCWLSP